LTRFPHDDEAQVRAVLHDLCESQLLFSSGSGSGTTYRATSEEELSTLQQQRGSEASDELLVALMYRDGPLSLKEVASRAQLDASVIEAALERLLAAGRIEQLDHKGSPQYKAGALVIPLGAEVGWEAAVFDHFKALVTTILCRLREDRIAPGLADQIGGSTYTIDVWAGHPLAEEVYGTLGRFRASLSELRSRVAEFNGDRELPASYTRVLIYAGQCLIQEDNERLD
jgi:hypothetical protein